MYTSSNGVQKDPSEMPGPYLENALKKAQAEGNIENIEALTAEKEKRDQAEKDQSTQP